MQTSCHFHDVCTSPEVKSFRMSAVKRHANHKNNPLILSNFDFTKSLINTARNVVIFFLRKIFIRKYKSKKIVPFMIFKSKYYGHTTPKYFKKNISKKIYNDYFKFTIYRKFSDQLYSMYNHKMSYEKFISYDKWVSKNIENFYKSVLEFYSKDLYFLNFHNMEASLKIFCKRFKINKNLAKKFKKIKIRSNNIKFPKVLKKNTKKKIIIKEKIIYDLVKERLLSK